MPLGTCTISLEVERLRVMHTKFKWKISYLLIMTFFLHLMVPQPALAWMNKRQDLSAAHYHFLVAEMLKYEGNVDLSIEEYAKASGSSHARS